MIHMSAAEVPWRSSDRPEPLMVFSGTEAPNELEAVAVMSVIGIEKGSTVKLQTLPLKTVESGGLLTSSTRQWPAFLRFAALSDFESGTLRRAHHLRSFLESL